jgi:uncharacterized protein YjbI with pentapeptide repeats
MPSLLRRILSGHGSKARGAQAADGAKSVALEEPPLSEAPEPQGLAAADAASETTAKSTVEIDVRQIALDERGLIPADKLPSAAEALAALFPPEEHTDPFSSEATGVSAPALDAARITAQVDMSEPQESIESSGVAVSDPAQVTPEAGEVAPVEMHAPAETNAQENARRGGDEKRGEAATEPAEPELTTGIIQSAEEPAAMRESVSAEGKKTAEEPVVIERAEAASGPFAHAESESTGPEHAREAADAEILKAASLAQLESPAASGRDWKLEEKLASHLEWLDSRGKAGLRADLSDASLEGQELIGVKLKFADLHDANLRAADLLLADLRDASLVRADLEDSCLVGANLEAANLEGASLETAMGLVPRQIAGANLRDALLPPQIMEFQAASKYARASRIAWRCFAPLIPAVLLSWLIVWKTKDAQLLTDSAVIPYLQSHTAAAAMPTAQIFLLGPLVILSLYLVFHFQLQKVWEAVMELPAIFPDGHELDDRGPGLIIGLLRAHFWWIGRDGPSSMWVEKTFSVVAAYWLAPFTLVLFWARYLTMQDVKGTLLQALFAAVATGVALHATLKSGRRQEQWTTERRWTARTLETFRRISSPVTASALGIVLLFLSVGTIVGVPHEHSRAPQYSPASIRRWAADVFWIFGFDPYADLTEATLSRKPPRWTGANAQVASVKGPQLNEAKFRYAQAYGAFLANAHLWQSDFDGAYLSEADLRGADLGNSNLQRAVLDGALLTGANLNRARLDQAVLARADLRWANLSYASLANAMLVDSRMDGATLYDAQMSSASLARAGLEKTDLRGAFLNAADLDHADLQQALLWSAKLPGANLYGAKLQGAVAIDADLRGADLREAQFAGTVLSDADLSGANLDRADLRGALELTARQVCTSKSRRGALLDDALAMQVATQCGGLQ